MRSSASRSSSIVTSSRNTTYTSSFPSLYIASFSVPSLRNFRFFLSCRAQTIDSFDRRPEPVRFKLEWFWAQRPSSSQAKTEIEARRRMSRPLPVDSPSLTPQFCFNERVLRDFLRLSRTTIDDSITQHLNALLKPARERFDPSSTDVRQLDATSRRRLPSKECESFKDDILFPSWQTRSDVLNYCAVVATSPDPEDPDLVARQVESAKEHERVVDERLDPYSSRYFPREARTESLANLIRNERTVEQIIRARTWGAVTERCDATGSWEDALNRWRERKHIQSDTS